VVCIVRPGRCARPVTSSDMSFGVLSIDKFRAISQELDQITHSLSFTSYSIVHRYGSRICRQSYLIAMRPSVCLTTVEKMLAAVYSSKRCALPLKLINPLSQNERDEPCAQVRVYHVNGRSWLLIRTFSNAPRQLLHVACDLHSIICSDSPSVGEFAHHDLLF